jgi:RNA polymerase sigma-70 factor (ECF subfamily)
LHHPAGGAILGGEVEVLGTERHFKDVSMLFQQVVLQALQSRGHFTDPDHLLAWALRVVRHRAVDLLRARKVQCLDDAVLDLLEQQWARSSTHEITGRVEALQECLEQLPERSRSLLRLRYEEGLRCARVAERLRHSVCAVYHSLSRVHHQLRQCVEQRLLAAGRVLAVDPRVPGGLT